MKTNFYKALLDQDLKEKYLSKLRTKRIILLIVIIICNYGAYKTSFVTLVIGFLAAWKFIQNEVDIRILKSMKKEKGLTNGSTE